MVRNVNDCRNLIRLASLCSQRAEEAEDETKRQQYQQATYACIGTVHSLIAQKRNPAESAFLREMLERADRFSKQQSDVDLDGGPGSGNWGHKGRPGKRGGSAAGGGAHNRMTA